jgi:phenylalanyl-tRNA synthetase beta chain
MLIPYSWLAEYIDDMPDAAQLGDSFTMGGLEVEGYAAPAPGLEGRLVVARIDSIERHPDADRLVVCRLDDGDTGREVVCGASNMRAGDLVILALPGSCLPGGLKIKKSSIRGKESAGMLCAASELGLAEAGDGIIVLSADTDVDGVVSPGDDAAALLGLDDPVFELSITPNRGDCLSVNGLVRELGVLLGVPAAGPGATQNLPGGFDRAADAPVTVDHGDTSFCPAYRALQLTDLSVGPSPHYIRQRLTACGYRPVNNIVDITNYVMLELGQPMHAFDRELLDGSTITVGEITTAEELETLDGNKCRLEAGDLVIRDERGVVALAGVMGGQRSAISDGSTRVLLESALFDPSRVRRTARRLGLGSESSYRFERGVDPGQVEGALWRAADLLVKHAGATVEGGLAASGELPTEGRSIALSVAGVGSLLGRDVAAGRCREILKAIGCTVKGRGDKLKVDSPVFRSDISRDVDLVEEIARVEGYDLVPASLPVMQMNCRGFSTLADFEGRARTVLRAMGFTESVALAFAGSEVNQSFRGVFARAGAAVELLNPLRATETELRRSLLPGLLEGWQVNHRNGFDRVDLFSVGRCFQLLDGQPEELDIIAGVLSGPRRARGPGDAGPPTLWDAKAAVVALADLVSCADEVSWTAVDDAAGALHPRASARAWIGDKVLGVIASLHPEQKRRREISSEIWLFEIDSRVLVEYRPSATGVLPLARFPSSARDLSLLVPMDVLAGEIIRAAGELDEPLLNGVSVFDDYRGKGVKEGYKALAFSFEYRSPDRTLTEEEVAALHSSVVEMLLAMPGVELRA